MKKYIKICLFSSFVLIFPTKKVFAMDTVDSVQNDRRFPSFYRKQDENFTHKEVALLITKGRNIINALLQKEKPEEIFKKQTLTIFSSPNRSKFYNLIDFTKGKLVGEWDTDEASKTRQTHLEAVIAVSWAIAFTPWVKGEESTRSSFSIKDGDEPQNRPPAKVTRASQHPDEDKITNLRRFGVEKEATTISGEVGTTTTNFQMPTHSSASGITSTTTNTTQTATSIPVIINSRDDARTPSSAASNLGNAYVSLSLKHSEEGNKALSQHFSTLADEKFQIEEDAELADHLQNEKNSENNQTLVENTMTTTATTSSSTNNYHLAFEKHTDENLRSSSNEALNKFLEYYVVEAANLQSGNIKDLTFLSSGNFAYDRSGLSSHYTGHTIRQTGIDARFSKGGYPLTVLPFKNTHILFGRVHTRGGKDKTFIKLEGAGLGDMYNILMHSASYTESEPNSKSVRREKDLLSHIKQSFETCLNDLGCDEKTRQIIHAYEELKKNSQLPKEGETTYLGINEMAYAIKCLSQAKKQQEEKLEEFLKTLTSYDYSIDNLDYRTGNEFVISLSDIVNPPRNPVLDNEEKAQEEAEAKESRRSRTRLQNKQPMF